MSDIDELKARLAHARERLAAALDAMNAADRKQEAAHALGGGIPGFGGSGNQRAAQQVRGALGSAHRAWQDAQARIDKWSHRVKSLERRITEQERKPFERADVIGAGFIHDGTSWRKVVRVNAKTVSVVNWQVPEWEPDRIPFDKIRAVHMPIEGTGQA
ncbi:hypothetical protein [Microbacterium hydrocarbonoxydans]|uniref:hypothetical protein n=1 Tax=Microbacterium hydrocarbonoxydans TaxID=273678 RepID=UPI003D957EE3